MKYLFVTLMWNAQGNARAGRYFCGLLSVLQPEWNDAAGRYTHLDDMSALTQWTKDAVYHNITVLETAKPRKEI